jgi:ABC-2 type transport system permease protein
MSLRAAMRWELRLARRARAIRIVLLLLVAAITLALWSGRSLRARWEAEVSRHLERGDEERERQLADLAAGDAMSGFPMFVSVRLALSPAPLVEVAAGRSDLDPRTATVTPRGHAGVLFRDYQVASPLALAAARFDLAFVLVFLVPILVIALGYNLLSEERERGIDRLLAVQGVSRWDLALGRTLVRGALLALPIVVAFVVVWSTDPSAERAVRVALCLLAVGGYLAGWWGIALAMATVKARESTTLLALLGIWIVLALLAPAAIGAFAKTVDPPPSRFELIAAARAVEARSSLRAAELIGGYVHDHPELERSRPAKDPNAPKPPWDYVGWGQRYYVIVREIDRAVAPIVDRFDATLAEQRTTAGRLRLLSPPLTLQSTLAGLAGTDEGRALAFRAQARAFQQRLRDDMGHRTMGQRDLDAQELAALRGPAIVESSIALVAEDAAIPLFALWLVALTLWGIARRRLPR